MDKVTKIKKLIKLYQLYKLWIQYKKRKLLISKRKNCKINKTKDIYKNNVTVTLNKKKNLNLPINEKKNLPTTKRLNRKKNLKRDIQMSYYKVTFLVIKNEDPDQFFGHTRMNNSAFDLLLSLIGPRLKKEAIRKSVEPQCRLALTLLYLSQGISFQSLALSWKLGKETIRSIIYETCQIIWEELNTIYVSQPAINELEKISSDFWQKLNIPNCIGCIDGKHIAIKWPSKSESDSVDYKKINSIVLLAACDAKYSFTFIDVGSCSCQQNGGIFQQTKFGQHILQGNLPIPEPKKLPNSEKILPHFFVAGAAFPLHMNIIKPYSGQNLPLDKNIYNKRISRAKRVIENSFGILVARWRILSTTINAFPENVKKIILACVALHNYLSLNNECKDLYIPAFYVDWEDDKGNLHEGLWRREVEAKHNLDPILPSRNLHMYGGKNSKRVREELCNFFNNEGKMNI